ncbi:MAG: uroporphyrinogen decarboxylase, partial [Candidatus Marinimicrobia bacterium]|nr:uroporphyrinogen decarboxylase [Candidatus Neomarinimicrobiota bacterium]
VKFFHNDASCKVSAPYLPEIGVNLFNMGFDVSFNDVKRWTRNQVTLLGNIPPRDVLANAEPNDIRRVTLELLDSLEDSSRVILSCGGGMPPGVTTENINAFVQTVASYNG